jgi:hypothetical protein
MAVLQVLSNKALASAQQLPLCHGEGRGGLLHWLGTRRKQQATRGGGRLSNADTAAAAAAAAAATKAAAALKILGSCGQGDGVLQLSPVSHQLLLQHWQSRGVCRRVMCKYAASIRYRSDLRMWDLVGRAQQLR